MAAELFEIEQPSKPYEPPHYSLLTLFYWVTLLALSLGLFGPVVGSYAFALVAFCHFAIANLQSGVTLTALIVIAHAVGWFLSAGIDDHPRAIHAKLNSSANNLKQCILGLNNYDLTYSRLPSAIKKDTEGKALHSWRVAILPYIEQQLLFGRIDLDVPWNEGANLTVFPGTALKDLELEWSYHSPRRPADRSPRYETHYFAIIGEGTVWEEGEATTLEDVPDGAASTIVLIEAAGRGVRWCEPRDLTIDEAVDLLTGSDGMQWEDPGFFYSVTYRGDGLYPRHVAFADGRVAALGLIEDRELARALLTRSGGEQIDLDKVLSLPHQPQREVIKVVPNWGNVVSTSLFIGLVVAPFLKRWARVAPTVVSDKH